MYTIRPEGAAGRPALSNAQDLTPNAKRQTQPRPGVASNAPSALLKPPARTQFDVPRAIVIANVAMETQAEKPKVHLQYAAHRPNRHAHTPHALTPLRRHADTIATNSPKGVTGNRWFSHSPLDTVWLG
jgi:hypothetical protein